MNRRSFIGTLMASVGVLAINPEALLWRPADAVALPPIAPDALLTLEQITMELARRIAARVDGSFVDGAKIGQGPLAHQFNVTMYPPTEVGPEGLVARYIDPAAEALISALEHARINAFGRLPLPSGVERAVSVIRQDTGVSVRGILAYDVGVGQIMRFDVLCGRA